jgi:hypothetical protein
MTERRRSAPPRQTERPDRFDEAALQRGRDTADERFAAASRTVAKLRRPPDEKLPGKPVKGGGRK